jgi:gliding motility-associated protein GldM
MAGGKLPPRQKMIGMMYLVLTALLAMNVSKDILDAFITVNEGLEKTNYNFGKKVEKTYSDFEGAMKKDEAKTKPFYDRAMQAKKATKELVEYISRLKIHVIKETDKIENQAMADTMKLKYVNAKDNYDIPTAIMIGPEPATPKTGDMTAADLKARINAYQTSMEKLFSDTALFPPKLGLAKDMKEKLSALEAPDAMENGVKVNWESKNFYHLPLAGVVTNLSSIEAKIRNAESDIVQALLGAVKATDFTFDKLTAKVIAPSSYLIQGEEYKADVLLVAFNSTQKPKIYVTPVDTSKGEDVDPRLNKNDPGKEIEVSGGMGRYKVGTSAAGEQKWSGVIQVEKPGGGYKYYPFAASYTVAPPALVVSPTKMNVFYIGVDNPVDISVPGYANDAVVPNPVGVTLTPDPARKGSYIARAASGTKEASIKVSVKQGSATKPLAGEIKFRVKPLPNPIAKVGGKVSGESVTKALILATGGVASVMENFDFDLKVTVASFTVTASVGGDTKSESANGFSFTEAQKGLINKLKPNSRLIVEDIKVRMPDGSVRTLSPVTLKISG